jgi:ACR3 family arsenite efflux pump ArsB
VLARALVVMLVLPMVFGFLARRVLVRRYGNAGFARIAPVFPTISMATMLANIFLIFFSMASTLLDQWTLMLWLLVPNILFMAATFLLVTLTTRFAGFSYPENMAIAFTSTGKNNATAVAIALSTFSPMVAVPAATMPIFQIVFMILYLRLAPWLAHCFAGAAPRRSVRNDRGSA